jgi:hypothetical protein
VVAILWHDSFIQPSYYKDIGVKIRHSSDYVFPCPAYGFQPQFSPFERGVLERILELSCSMFYFLKDTFNGVAIDVSSVAEVHPEFEQAGMQPGTPSTSNSASSMTY